MINFTKSPVAPVARGGEPHSPQPRPFPNVEEDMAALPYIQLYPADYLADTTHLTLQEHGAYLLLILNYWQRGFPPKDNDKRLSAICRISESHWLELREILSEFFDIRDGCWYHDRIEYDLEFVKSKSEKASRAGKASARKRIDNKDNSNERSTDVQQRTSTALNHTDTDTDTDTDKTLTSFPTETDKKNIPFQKIINLYHKTLPELPQCKKLTTKRKGYIRSRWNDGLPDLDHWESFFSAIRNSPFLMGKVAPNNGRQKAFIADLEWVTNQSNYVKILEGKYHG